MSRKKKKNENKPRKMSIGIGIEVGSELEFRWNQEAQTFAYRVKKDGKTVKPVNSIICYSYDRPNKSPKFIIASSSPSLPPLPNFNEILNRFTYIVAVDTSYRYLGKDQICATCIIIIKIHEEPEGRFPIFQSSYGLEFWNPVNHPERFGWKKAIELIQGFKSYIDEQQYLLIVDPFIKRYLSITCANFRFWMIITCQKTLRCSMQLLMQGIHFLRIGSSPMQTRSQRNYGNELLTIGKMKRKRTWEHLPQRVVLFLSFGYLLYMFKKLRNIQNKGNDKPIISDKGLFGKELT